MSFQPLSNVPPDAPRSRRGFLAGLARAAAGGALASLGALLTWRSISAGDQAPAGPGQGHSCTGGFICRQCGLLESCILPQALSARRALDGGEGSSQQHE